MTLRSDWGPGCGRSPAFRDFSRLNMYVRSPCVVLGHHISRMCSYDENGCAVSYYELKVALTTKTGPAPTCSLRGLGRFPAYHSDCKFGREKSLEARLLPKHGPQSERGVRSVSDHSGADLEWWVFRQSFKISQVCLQSLQA